MTSVKLHPKIKMLTYSTVESVEGSVGNYHVKIRRKPRYIDESLCVGCMQCIDACVFAKAKFPNAFDQGLGLASRSTCPSPRRCRPCRWSIRGLPAGHPRQVQADLRRGLRGTQRLPLRRRGTDRRIRRGRDHRATGFKAFDPTPIEYYGTASTNVYTSLEVERLLNAGGPTGGKLVLRDG